MPRDQAPVVHDGMTSEANAIMATASEEDKEFALQLAQGVKASDAYCRIFPALAANCKQSTIWANASKLKHSPKVGLWLRHFRVAGCALSREGKINHAQHITRLAELSHEAQETGNYGAAVNAEVSAGKASGLYEQKLVIEDRRPEEILAELHSLLDVTPDSEPPE